jgi:hypothetical protein
VCRNKKIRKTYQSGSLNVQYHLRDLRVEGGKKKRCLKRRWIKLSEGLSQWMAFMGNVMSCVISWPFENLPTTQKHSSQRELYVRRRWSLHKPRSYWIAVLVREETGSPESDQMGFVCCQHERTALTDIGEIFNQTPLQGRNK